MDEAYELHQAYCRMFGTMDGRRIMADLERRGFYREPAFSADPARLAFNEGRRSLVLHVKQMLDERHFARLRHREPGKDAA